MFDYNYCEEFSRRKCSDVRPFQIELHPGPHCFGLSCTYCYGKNLQKNQSEISLSEYKNFISTLNQSDVHFELSGLFADPLSYEDILPLIELILKGGHSVGIHTKGHGPLVEVYSLLGKYYRESNYLTVSVDASSSDEYMEIHSSSDNKHFSEVQTKLNSILGLTDAFPERPKLNITSLLFKQNSNTESVERFIESYNHIGDTLRFSFPQWPCGKRPVNMFLNHDERESVAESISDVLSSKSILLTTTSPDRDLAFSQCISKKYNFVIAGDGFVYPCAQVASRSFSHLAFGNIKDHSFDEIWNSLKRKSVLEMSVADMNCRECGRRDEAINLGLGEG